MSPLNKHFGKALLFFLVLTTLASKSIALSSSLYEAMVPVPPELPTKSQAELIQEGLKTVLIQISGSEKTLASPAVKRALEAPDSYITRFSYKDDAEKKRFFRVKFDESRINELLRRSNAPILDQARPSTTVWMVVARDQDNPHWVSSESETELFKQLNADAKLRAIPLVFPLLDLADTEQVTEKTVWKDDFTALQEVSKRYNAEVLWIGKLSKQKSGWHGQWTLITNGKSDGSGNGMASGKPQTWDNTGENVDQVCRDALEELAKRLARSMQAQERKQPLYWDEQQYSIPDPTIANPPTVSSVSPDKFTKTKSQVSRFRLSVAGIRGIEQYEKLQGYLKTLPGVKDVEVSLVNSEQTLFDVVATSDRQTLINAIAKGQVLLENGMLAPVANAETPVASVEAPVTSAEAPVASAEAPVASAEAALKDLSSALPGTISEHTVVDMGSHSNVPITNVDIANADKTTVEKTSVDKTDGPNSSPADDNGVLHYKMAEVL